MNGRGKVFHTRIIALTNVFFSCIMHYYFLLFSYSFHSLVPYEFNRHQHHHYHQQIWAFVVSCCCCCCCCSIKIILSRFLAFTPLMICSVHLKQAWSEKLSSKTLFFRLIYSIVDLRCRWCADNIYIWMLKKWFIFYTNCLDYNVNLNRYE